MSNRSDFVRKWAGFLSALWLMSFSGCFTFPSYSSALKDVLNINQKLLNGLGIAWDVGDSVFGIIAGILINHFPVWTLFILSASVGFLGYGFLWLLTSNRIDSPVPYWVVFMAAVVAGSSVCLMNVAVFNTSVRSFVQNRGPVVGLFKSYMGLSAAVFVAFCKTLFSNSESAYLLMLTIIPATFCLLSAIVFQPVPSAQTEIELQVEKASFHAFNILACCLAGYVAALGFVPTSSLQENYACKLLVILLLIAVLGSPALVPMVQWRNLRESQEANIKQTETLTGHEEQKVDANEILGGPLQARQSCVDDSCSEGDALLSPLLENRNTKANVTCVPSKDTLQIEVRKLGWSSRLRCWSFWTVTELGEDMPTLSLFRTWHYYLFYLSLFCGCGCTGAFCNNLGQLSEALGISNSNLFASLFSLGNFSGRLAAGNVSEYFMRTMGTPRPLWMGVTKVGMILSFAWLATGSIASLYSGSAVLGFCLGCHVTLSVPIISEFYGLKHFGTNFAVTNTIFLTGMYVFASIAGFFYDVESTAQERSDLTCYGTECYGTTFWIMVFCLTAAFVFDAILALISRPLYQKIKASNANLVPKTLTKECVDEQF